LEHERNVLKQKPARVAGGEQAKNFTHKAGIRAGDSRRPSCLAQVLTREPCRTQLDLGKFGEVPDVRNEGHGRKSIPQNALRWWIYLT
jgi:hypothetical protein